MSDGSRPTAAEIEVVRRSLAPSARLMGVLRGDADAIAAAQREVESSPTPTAARYSYRSSMGATYFLHAKEVILLDGRKQQIYFFAREAKAGEPLDAVPDGSEVVENPKTALPFLRQISK